MVQAPGVLPDPRTIAVVGASGLEGSNYYGSRLMANLVDADSGITVYPVNPRLAGESLWGWPVYEDLTSLPGVPDLVVVVTPTKAVTPVLVEAGKLGVRNCLVISNELGGRDAKQVFRAGVRDTAEAYGMRVIGPNSMGVLCGTTMMNASFASGAHGGGLKAGSLAMVAQSGSAISYLLETNRDRQLGYSWLISSGDEAAASLESLFEAVVEDDATEVVLLFIEGISDGMSFRRTAERAAELGKPVVMLQVGVSDIGKEAVHSHTGRLAGLESAFDAVGAESGLIRARTFDDLFTFGRVLVEQAVPRADRSHGRRVCVLTSSGGSGSYAADHFGRLGWTLPSLRPDVRAALESAVGQADLENPVDLTGSWANPDLLPTALGILAQDPSIDAFVITTGAGGALAAPVARALVAAPPATDAELYVAWQGMSAEVSQIFDGSAFSALGDVASVAAAAQASAVFRNRPTGTGGAKLVGTPADRTAAAAGDRSAAAGGDRSTAAGGDRTAAAGGDRSTAASGDRSTTNGGDRSTTTVGDRSAAPAGDGRTDSGSEHLSEPTVQRTAGATIESLQEHGVRCARTVVLPAGSHRDVAKAAAEIGYPLAVKIDSPSLVHKIDSGGVVVGVRDPDQLATQLDTFDTIIATGRLTDARIMIQEMVSGAELFAGIKYDESFGHLLMVGVGGTYIELLGETETMLLPTTRDRIEAGLRRRPLLNSILSGYRGQGPADVESLLDVICGFAEWGTDPAGPLLLEADLNPIFLSAKGAVVVDARSSWATS